MNQMDVKANEVVQMYKKLLAPYGYTLVPIKVTTEEKFWEPANSKEYDNMTISQINETLSNLVNQRQDIEKLILDTREKILKVMESIPNNETMTKLYVSTYAREMFDKNLLRVESDKIIELSKLASYLTIVRARKRMEDLNKKLKNEVDAVASVDFGEENGTKILKVKLK